MPRNLITVPAAALEFGVSRETVWSWIKQGLLRSYRLPSGVTRIDKDEIDRFFAEQEAAK